MLKQLQAQKQHHTILPQQIELLNLFHLNTLQLEQRIQDELTVVLGKHHRALW